MNFKEFYFDTEKRLKETILSLWATGDADMQGYFGHILGKEKLMAEPVFQTLFPWEPASDQFGTLTDTFDKHFIDSLDKISNEEYRFPISRFPYEHQVRSWKMLLNSKKSIAVTTGTGSGKTECFMLPVLYDIHKNCRNSNGINAIFLYPLNALIGSQKKRIDAWCRALGGINYAVYNGNTDETVPKDDAYKGLPELLSRRQIRNTPPQILFTNPSMLEYILVRNKDVELLNNSNGTLRWILLDEAHTLTGSSATEMALLIRRVVDAFNVDIEKIRFAITSATVGNGSESEAALKMFMTDLCGIKESNIQVIKGQRILPKISEPTIAKCNLNDIRATDYENLASFEPIHALRKNLLKKNSLTLSEFGNFFDSKNLEDNLDAVDRLSGYFKADHSLLPVRGHFFVRGIGGIYVCTNPECDKHGSKKPALACGTMTTIAGKICSCGYPLLELVACRSCGNHMLYGEKLLNRNNGSEFVSLRSALIQDAFLIEEVDDDTENENGSMDNEGSIKRELFITKRNSNRNYIQNNNLTSYSISQNAELREGEDFIEAEINGQLVCAYCGEHTNNPIHFRISSSFINRALSDIILEQTPEADPKSESMLWQGRKYISFTDSRQGTAKISALINIDNESNWIRSQVFHRLCEKRKKSQTVISDDELRQMIAHLEEELKNTTIPILRSKKIKEIEEFKSQLNSEGSSVVNSRLTWQELKNQLISLRELRTLYNGIKDGTNNGINYYLSSLLYDQFARRLPRERSLENLGMVNLAYPELDNVPLPGIASTLNITNGEWKSLLKIGSDYILRNQFHYFLDPGLYRYSTSHLGSYQIYPSDTQIPNVKKWPSFVRNKIIQSRLILLICAGLGYHNLAEIDNAIADRINELLEAIWRTLRTKILSPDDQGFKIRLEEKTVFELADALWLCPVKKRLIDVHFKGYSPWITGSLTPQNITQFRIENSVRFPYFPYPHNMNMDGTIDLNLTKAWMEESFDEWKQKGLWNNLHERIILKKPLYAAGEHSAQQNAKRLSELEDKFQRSELNILSCSTTMEMGVDIGGIAAVVMNNVPPRPANYLQRTGRAGRRSESKSLALTFCAPNPIGLNAIQNPMWALNHNIAPPSLSFKSLAVVERHVNAFFLGKFVQRQEIMGLNVRDNIEVFFLGDNPLAGKFENWLTSSDSLLYEQQLLNIIQKTPLGERTFYYLLNSVSNKFTSLSERTKAKNTAYETQLLAFENQFGQNAPEYKAVNYQKRQFLRKNAISYLVEEGFLPSAGLPTGIIEFNTVSMDDLNHKNVALNKSNPSFYITRALSEFAPGNNVIVDGKNYKSEGIVLQSERGVQATRMVIQSCANCGYQRIVETSSDQNINSKCPHCDQTKFRGIQFKDGTSGTFTELIEPAGFAVDIYQSPTRKITEYSNALYIDPLLLNIKPWLTHSSSLCEIRESEENAEILYYNTGQGNGYSVCFECGRTAFDRKQLNNHNRLRGGRNEANGGLCAGNDNAFSIKDNVILGGRFQTDFCELRFKDNTGNFSKDDVLLSSLGTILTKSLAAYIAIEENEVSFGIKKYGHYSSVFIFDTAKGGSGYSSLFSLYAKEIFKTAKTKLEDCSCERACTRCLIDRDSQWYLNDLDRFAAIDWLSIAINESVPEEIRKNYPSIEKVFGTAKEDINRYNYSDKIEKVYFYASESVNEWDLETDLFFRKLKEKVKVGFVFQRKPKVDVDNQDLITLIQMINWAEFYIEPMQESSLKTMCKVILKDHSVYDYLAVDFNNNLDSSWGNTVDGIAYKQPGIENVSFIQYLPDINKTNTFDVFLTQKDNLDSDSIADLILQELNGKINLKNIMQGKSFDITYSDRYLKRAFGCILVAQFLSRLRALLNFEINSFTFKGQHFSEERSPNLLSHNFKDSSQRNKSLEHYAKQHNIPDASVICEDIPHYRIFEFKNNDLTIIIRPDGGIEHGWFMSDRIYLNEKIDSREIFKIKPSNQSPILYTINIS